MPVTYCLDHRSLVVGCCFFICSIEDKTEALHMLGKLTPSVVVSFETSLFFYKIILAILIPLIFTIKLLITA
jgi:hypothetical protein